ncbi:unnamed protein product [Arabis nemorensis]|uniref:F-box associated domain-containing protein n=1 Tax=Arabis nemorensis TaxID=586526 RepID=A0A565C994_9BRAS|nr:unnamed protein product [Arabis nemorensis]
MIRCTNRSINSHISDYPNFEKEYSSQFASYLFYISCKNRGDDYYLNCLYCKIFKSSCRYNSPGMETHTYGKRCYILGSCSGLLLLYIGGLFVANPLTKRFRLLDHSGSKLLPEIVDSPIVRTERAMCVGFAVNRTTKRFKIVCIFEMQTVYGFEISDGDSWRLSETTITRRTSSKCDLTMGMKPVYLDDNLHWLRNDGTIIAFNPETEQARFIPSIFHREPKLKLLFTSDDKINRLTLISGTKEEISVYTLLGNLNWGLARRIKNVPMEESTLEFWHIVAYNGERLVVREKRMEIDRLQGVVHVYHMGANSWTVLGSTNHFVETDIYFYKFTPSLFFIEEDEKKKVIVAPNDKNISYLTKIMSLIHNCED